MERFRKIITVCFFRLHVSEAFPVKVTCVSETDTSAALAAACAQLGASSALSLKTSRCDVFLTLAFEPRYLHHTKTGNILSGILCFRKASARFMRRVDKSVFLRLSRCKQSTGLFAYRSPSSPVISFWFKKWIQRYSVGTSLYSLVEIIRLRTNSPLLNTFLWAYENRLFSFVTYI